MNDKDKIIYEILFGEGEDFIFDISPLFEFIEDYIDIINEIVTYVNKGKVTIIKDIIEVEGDDIFWRIKIKRQ